MSKNVKREVGAAKYEAGSIGGKFVVVMFDDEGFCSPIQNCKSLDAAEKEADKWQTKENKAVIKARASDAKGKSK